MMPSADLAAYERASRRLLGLIGGEGTGTTPGSGRFDRAAARLAQTRSLLESLGDPQRSYPIVHVTGTSGKGSVAAMIAAILAAEGYRVGLRTSPYLQVATEKLQIGTQLTDAQSLDRLSAEILEAHERLYAGSPLRYPEAWSALSFVWFAEQQVDLAVVEVGAGGRFDSTTVFDPALSVITSVGLDHTASLGPTLADIAWHKAGIIKTGAVAVVGPVPNEARQVIEEEARSVGAPVVRVGATPFALPRRMAMPGDFQVANAQVAVAAVEALTARRFSAPEKTVAAGLALARLPGRLERMPGGNRPVVWLDGAHNADKIAALTRESCLIADGGSGPVVVLGVLKSKDAAAISVAIAPFAAAIVVTEPTVIGRSPLIAADLAASLRASGFNGPLHAEPDPNVALAYAEDLARAQGSNVVATGSMYLAGQLRGRWFPDDQIVVQRTPWPARPEETAQALPERSVAL